MRAIRFITFFLRRIFRSNKRRSGLFDVEKKPNIVARAGGLAAGSVYAAFQRWREAFRVAYRNKERRYTEFTIPIQILRKSVGILLLLTAALLISLFAEWLIDRLADVISGASWMTIAPLSAASHLFSFPDQDFVELVLEICIGAISALLGLLFALYGVGFQITTEKYSSKVSDFVNQETVGSFFFKLLVFTDIFALGVLLRVKMVTIPPVVSFFVVLALVIVCLLGIIVFKNHYILTIKPKSFFERLLSDIQDNLRLATDRKRYSFRSWSIVQTARSQTADRLSLLRSLFEDLWQSKSWNDVTYVPHVIASLLIGYASRKKYIDRERGWWFPHTQEEVKASNSATLPLKLNFELQGKGPLRMNNPNYQWLENRAFEILGAVESRIGTAPHDTHLLEHVIDCYQTILAGSYAQDRYGRYHKSTIGLYESQELDSFERGLNGFIALYEKVQTEDERGAYLNALFAIGTVLIEGFDYSKFREAIAHLVTDGGMLSDSYEETARLDLPSMFYGQLLDYWMRLDLEVQCEGRVVTPNAQLEKETITAAQKREAEYFQKFFPRLCEHGDVILAGLYSNGQHKDLSLFIKARLEWISRMLYLGKPELVERYGPKVASAGIYLPYLPKQTLLEAEFWEELEKLLFPSVIDACPDTFKALSGLLVLMMSAINTDEKDVDALIYRNRLTLILGGFVYLVSELRQDRSMLVTYAQAIEKSYQQGRFVEAMEILADPKGVGGLNLTLKLINWETTRYHHWFGQILGKISELPRKYDHVRHYSGMQEVADHPSKFIRTISYRAFSPEEECSKAFVEWLKKREEIRKLVAILSKQTNVNV